MARDVSNGVPGPDSTEWTKRREEAVPRAVFNTAPIFVEDGEGARVTDIDGNSYIDLAGGLAVLNLGRKHPRVMEAVRGQLDKTMHECFHVSMYTGYVELAETLNRLTPGDHPKKTMLANSGAEAVENAVKIARYATGRQAIVCFTNAFHGRTLVGMTLTAKDMPYKKGFGPYAPEMYRLPFPYEYRPPLGTPETVGIACAEFAADAIDSQIGSEAVAGVIIEPVQGEGGYIPAPKDFMTALREICTERDILLIDDEIQTGMGRTGEMWGIDHYGIVPELITSAKSLAAGLPLSSITGPSEVMDAPHVGGLGGTYGGNPVACAAALAVLTELSEGDVLQRARAQGERIRSRIVPLVDELTVVGDVRGLGPMVGIELVLDKQTKEPAKLAAAAVVKACYEAGVLVLKAGTYDNVVRLMAPLVISDDDLDEGLDVLIEALRSSDAAV